MIKAVKFVEATPVIDLSETAPIHTRFTSAINPDVSLRFVADSGVCETTPGVHQISGYVEVGTNMSMVSISVKVRSAFWFNLGFSGSGSLSLEILQKLLLSHSGLLRVAFYNVNCGHLNYDTR